MGMALDRIRFSVDDLIAEDDRVAARLTASARQVGELRGMPATGNSYEIDEIHIFRLRGGRIVEHWHQFDAMGMMQQLKGNASDEGDAGSR
jgi:predicted ester cyclase